MAPSADLGPRPAPATGDNGAAFDPARIRAVVFDCYGTLIDFEERAFAPAIETLLRAHGVDHVAGNDVWTHWMASAREHARANGRDPEKPLEGPEPPFASFAETWVHHFQHAFTQSAVDAVAPQEALAHVFDLLSRAPAYPEAADVVDTLRQAGYQIGVASNADDAHLYPALEHAGIRADFVLSSEAVRAYKPRRPFFAAVVERTGVTAQETIYVGDSPYSDVTGARQIGMHAYWVRRYEDASREQWLHYQPTLIYPDLRGLVDVLVEGRDA